MHGHTYCAYQAATLSGACTRESDVGTSVVQTLE